MGIPMLKEYVLRKCASIAFVAATAVLLGSCSSSVTRLDFPTFGLGSSDNSDTAPVTVHSTARVTRNAENKIIRGGSSLAEFDPGDIGEQNNKARNSYMPPQVAKTETSPGRYPVERRSLSPVSGSDGRSYETAANARAYEPARPVKQPARSFLPTEPSGYDYNGNRISNDAVQRTASVSPSRDISSRSIPSRQGQAVNGKIIVQPGDTLYSIGRRYNVSIVKLMELNELSDSNIVVGQRLRLPDDAASEPKRQVATLSRKKPAVRISSGTYTVKPGDTFHSIARKVGVDSAELADVNGITDTNSLRVGEVLILPTTSTKTTPTDEGKPKVAFSAGESGFTVRPVKTKTIKVASLDDNVVPANPAANETKDAEKSKQSGATKSISAFRWPVQGRIIEKFGARGDGTNNDGINLAVPKGTQVKAAEDGIVAYAGSELKGYGNLILIRHADGWVSAYAHNEKLLVKRGETIKRGQVIARAGMTGSVDQPQVHFELRQGSKPVDPMKYMSGT